MAAILLPNAKQYYALPTGLPNVGGKVYTYAAGTNTPKATFSDAAGLSPNPNPVILDARGEAAIFWNGAYKVVLRDAADVIIWTVDNVVVSDLGLATGASQIGTTGGGTVQSFIDAVKSASGAGVVGFQQLGAGPSATPQFVEGKLRQIVSVKDRPFGAVADGVTDDRAAFNAAAAAVGVNGTIVVPKGAYFISDVVDILSGQTWLFEGAVLKHGDDTKTILRANAVSDWSILGRLKLQGLLVSAGSSAETGLRVTTCKRFRVEGVQANLFKGKGIWIDGTNSGAFRGDRGQWTDCATHENTVGLQIDAGAEYNNFSNFNASGNITGVLIAGGNNTFVGGNIVDNPTTGVRLLGGTNHGHGMFVGVNINHNNSENVRATGVTNGYTFSGCHFYGNGTSTGVVWFEGSKGMQVVGGVIDCWLYNDSGAGSGANFVTDNYFPGDYGVTLNSNNAALGQLYLSGNYGPTGPSSLNDAAPVYVEAVRNGSTQNVSAGATTLIFDQEVRDNRAAYDNATGIFTAPVGGTYEIEASIAIGAASGFTNGYVAVSFNNTTDLGYIPIVALSGTLGSGQGVIRVTMAANDTLRLKSTVGGVTPVMNTTQSRISISLVA